MLLLLLIHLQYACVFSASVQPSAIQILLPCSNLMLAGNYLFWFSYAFPKRLRHFSLFAFSQLSYVFSSHLFKIHHQNSPTCNTATTFEQSFMELLWKHKNCWKRVFWQLMAPHLQPGAHHLKLLS